MKRLVIIRGAGEIASAIALRIYRAGCRVLMLEEEYPQSIRRTVSFASAIYEGSALVERTECFRVESVKEAEKALKNEQLVIMVDPEAACLKKLEPRVLVDAIYAKKNTGTTMDMAPLTVAIGPGFAAGYDVDVVIETALGHTLGAIIHNGQAMPEKTRSLYARSHIMTAPLNGRLEYGHAVGMYVKKGEFLGNLIADNATIRLEAQIDGVLRGMLHDQCPVEAGMEIAEIDAAATVEDCFSLSDKVRCISGGVLEEIMAYFTEQEKTSSKFSFFKRKN